MNSWKVILAALVIFGAGVVTGGLLVNYVQHGRPEMRRYAMELRRDAAQDLPLPRPEMLNKQFIQQLDDALHLAPDQRREIGKILAEGQQRNRELWKLVSPQMRLVIQDVNQRIRSKLTPAQQQQFEKLMKQMHPQRKPTDAHAPVPPLSATNLPASAPTNLPPDIGTNAPAL